MGALGFGLRNLFRNKIRTALVVVVIAIPFFLLLALQAIGGAVEQQSAKLMHDVNTLLQLRARGSMGHVNMIDQDRLLPASVIAAARNTPHVIEVEPYLLAMAPITFPNFVMHVGLAPSAAKRLESHGEAGSPRIVAGRDFRPADAGKDVAIIGQGYAEWAGIKPADVGSAKLTVDLSRTHPVIYAIERPPRELTIIGIYASGYVFGDLQLFMPIDTFRSIYGTDDSLSWVFVRADSATHVAQVAENLRASVGDVADIIVPESAAEFTATAAATVGGLSTTGTLLAIALVVVVIFFITLMQVRERRREIGTFKAIGAAESRIAGQFTSEAIATTLLGALFGLAIFRLGGEAIAGRLFALGVGPFLPSHYRPLFDSLAMDTTLSFGLLVPLLLGALVASVVGVAYSVWQALRLSPVEAMKHE